ncbi:MAG: hypothetical protein Q9180_004378, partial [Flavoplaca navasiana]
KRRRRKNKSTSDVEGGAGEIDDETREHRRKAREAKDLKKREIFKSAEFVYDSDDDPEADRLFFEREEMRRKGHAKKVLEVLKEGMVEGKGKRKSGAGLFRVKEKSKRRKVSSESEGEMDEDVQMLDAPRSPRIHELSDGTESGGEDTPLTTPLEELPPEQIFGDIPVDVPGSDGDSGMRKGVLFDALDDNSQESEVGDETTFAVPSRRRNRPTVVLESDSE